MQGTATQRNSLLSSLPQDNFVIIP